jgi:ribose-phosphate pyrophosphokinase
MHKERKAANEVESIVIIGNVVGKTCILIDDMVDTAGTLCMAAKELKE